MSSSVETVASDCFRPELQYPPYWYAPYPVAAEVSNGLPVDNGLYGNRPIDNGLYGNLPFDNALYSMAAYSAAFGLPPGGLSREDVVDDRNFSMILEELVAQLKKVMVKDMQKKMVENIGFKVYENWWKKEEDKEKVIHLSLSLSLFLPQSISLFLGLSLTLPLCLSVCLSLFLLLSVSVPHFLSPSLSLTQALCLCPFP